jgi:23S rRNA (adenine2503-C2)-methyltransferase
MTRDRPLNDLSFAELAALLAGASPDEARRVFAALWAPGDAAVVGEARGVRRAVLARVREGNLARLSVVERRLAGDGFLKYLFDSPLGGQFEAVRIPLFDRKHVVCVSSQVGCALGCAFCQTGRLGFSRNLAAWEMLEQVRRIRDEARLPVQHVVFMGMGEPLLNYGAVLRAARLLCEPGGLQVGHRNITISTAGVVPAIERYTREGHPYRLAFSVTSAVQEKRARLMPIERTHALPALVAAIRRYAEARRERAMVAYVMLAGVNTGEEDVAALRSAFEGIPIKLDLIDVADPTGAFRAPDAAEIRRFRDALQTLRSPIARRYSGGAEIGAACGTLAATRAGGTVVPA